MTDTQRIDIELEHTFGSQYYTFSATFVITNEAGGDIYKDRSAIVMDLETMRKGRALFDLALGEPNWKDLLVKVCRELPWQPVFRETGPEYEAIQAACNEARKAAT